MNTDNNPIIGAQQVVTCVMDGSEIERPLLEKKRNHSGDGVPYRYVPELKPGETVSYNPGDYRPHIYKEGQEQKPRWVEVRFVSITDNREEIMISIVQSRYGDMARINKDLMVNSRIKVGKTIAVDKGYEQVQLPFKTVAGFDKIWIKEGA